MNVTEITKFGGSDALASGEREVPEPGDGEVRVEVTAAGLNFADVMQRRGLYPGIPGTPFVPGMEVAGTVDAVGAGVEGVQEGDRVAAMLELGGYAEYAIADAELLLPVPDGLSLREAAAVPVQFLTAHCCLFGWGELVAGERVLVQAAAGGVGTAAVQLASEAGAEVFGTASTAEKLDHASSYGCDHPINYEEEDFAAVIDDETAGEGVDLVLESVGGDVFDRSLESLAHFGRLVTYGVASGQIATVQNQELLFANQSVRGFHIGFAAEHDIGRVRPAIEEVTDALADGRIEVVIGEEFPLEEAAAAHEYVEGRQSTGKVLLIP